MSGPRMDNYEFVTITCDMESFNERVMWDIVLLINLMLACLIMRNFRRIYILRKISTDDNPSPRCRKIISLNIFLFFTVLRKIPATTNDFPGFILK